MRIAVIALLPLLSGPFAASGQNPAPHVAQGQIPSQLPPSCPLDIHVHQGAGGGLVATDKDEKDPSSKPATNNIASRLKLFLNDPSKTNRHIVKARVKVRGLGDRAKLLPLGSNPEGGPDMAMTVTIPLTTGSNPDFSGDLVLPGFTAALSVELKSVTLDTGEVWSFKDQACRVAPEMLMLLHD